MRQHVRANLWLVFLCFLLCAVVYPLAIWGTAIGLFPDKARGSLVERDGRPVGSRLIGQPFTADEYFHPRPSAVAYNAAASGASNWASSNPLLRDRVARQLGTLARFRDGRPVGPDIERWFARQAPDFAQGWAHDHPALAEQWVKDHAAPVADSLKANPDAVKDNPADYVTPFFTAFSVAHPGIWPAADPSGKAITPAKTGDELRSYLFDAWLQANADAELEPVPGDLVMTSVSGLDPDITLAAARYQLARVAAAWALKTGRAQDEIAREIDEILRQHAYAPLGGIVGVELVNVLEVNLALERRYGAASSR